MSIVTGEATQREVADWYGVDRSTVVAACRVAKQGALDALAASVPGYLGVAPRDAALARANAELERLRASVAEQALITRYTYTRCPGSRRTGYRHKPSRHRHRHWDSAAPNRRSRVAHRLSLSP
ncbi:MAG: hypothetical protein ACRDS9_29235 [Pseudonocardiaceae bacterium]